MLIMTLAALASTAAVNLPPRLVSVDHAGRSASATYRGRLVVRTRDVGMSPPGRASTASSQRCNWRVMLSVSRELGSSETTRMIADQQVARGSRPGGCMEGRAAIAREAARHQAKADVALASIIDRDRALLLAEIDRMEQGRVATTEQRPSALH